MKGLMLMYNSESPDRHYIISAGQKIIIEAGEYNVVPIDLSNIIAGYKEPSPQLYSKELPKSLIIPEVNPVSLPAVSETINQREILNIQSGSPYNTLFTGNLTQLLNSARSK